MNGFFIYLLILSGSTYLIRAVPFVAVKKSITNRHVRSFLTYIPYAVLGAMTFPAVIYSTGNIASGVAGLVAGVIFAFLGKSLTTVALASCVSALLCEGVLLLL